MAVDQIKDKIRNKQYTLNDIPLLMKAIEEIGNSNEEAIKALKGQKDIAIQLTIVDELESYLEIKDGKLISEKGKHASPTVNIKMSKEIAMGLMSGELDTATSYTSGDIQVEIGSNTENNVGVDSVGTYTYVLSAETNVTFRLESDLFIGSIAWVSVQAVAVFPTSKILHVTCR